MSIELETHEALVVHIEGLQSTLGKRNVRIKELEEKLAQPVDVPTNVERLVKKAYKQGYKDCAAILMDNTKDAALALNKIRKSAFDEYLAGDKQ